MGHVQHDKTAIDDENMQINKHSSTFGAEFASCESTEQSNIRL